MIRILLADNRKIFCESLRISFEKHGDLQIIAEADDGVKAVQLSRELKPDVLIIDTRLSGLNGIETTRQIISEMPGVKIIALTRDCNRRSVTGMLRAGASGYLLTECGFEELIEAIHSVIGGQIYLSPKIMRIVVQEFLCALSEEHHAASSVLTPRQRQVLQLLAEGKSTKEIALPLNMSVKTVETHRANIMRKLGFNSMAELTKFAIREGLTSLED